MGREPTLILNLVAQVIATSVAFGLVLNEVQIVALNSLTAALVSFAIRRVVTPVKSPLVPVGSTITVYSEEKRTV